jgi:hypothetical protein
MTGDAMEDVVVTPANNNQSSCIGFWDIVSNLTDVVPFVGGVDRDVLIDHDECLNADADKKHALYLNAILRSIDGTRTNKHLKKFDFDVFRSDISSLID